MNCSFTVPWPPKVLSPNARVDFFAKNRAFQKYRTNVAFLMLMSMSQCGRVLVRHEHPLFPGGRVHFDLTFYLPTMRRRDEDNLLASFKAGIDGIRDATGIDDHFFHVTHDIGDHVVKGGEVEVTYEVLNE